MIKLTDIIQEAILDLWGKSEKDYKIVQKYIDQFCKNTLISYYNIGGYKSISNTDGLERELLKKSKNPEYRWKVVRRGQKITTIALYRETKYGWKSVLSATDSSSQGKKDFFMIKTQDKESGRSFSEVSGKMESILINKLNYPVIDAEIAKQVLHDIDGEDVKLDDDGIHYYRFINGSLHKKVMVGFPKGVDNL